MIKRICLICKKDFHIYLSAFKNGEGKYCSRKCKGEAWSMKARKRIVLLCGYCQKEFEVIPSIKQKFCSRFCFGKANFKNVQHFLNRTGIPSGRKGEKRTAEERKKLRQYGLKGLLKQQNMKEPTSIEKAVYDYLILKGILFEKQKLINGKFIVDAYIPSLNLVIEADGSYWHNLPKVRGKDKAENAYLTKCGFKLLRLTETEIYNGDFKERMVL